jgi:hypothetical protein
VGNTTRWIRVVVDGIACAALAACGSSGGGRVNSTGASDAGGTPSMQDGAVNETSTIDAGGDGKASATTPIALADAWVAGFYGTTAYQGRNVYSNTNTAGFPNGYYVQWRGDPGITLFGNVSDCSAFSDILLTRSYGWIPPTKNPRPLAEDYYWAIRDGVGFKEIDDVQDIQVGDTIALLYPPGGSDTGHVAWIDALPQPFSGAPDETGLSQYVVTVIDSTNGFHDGDSGPSQQADDRYLGPPSGGGQCTSDTQCITAYGANAICNTTSILSTAVCSLMGVGRGQMRLYVDSTGAIQGHTWSPNTESTFYPRPNPLPTPSGSFPGEDIVVGRSGG